VTDDGLRSDLVDKLQRGVTAAKRAQAIALSLTRPALET